MPRPRVRKTVVRAAWDRLDHPCQRPLSGPPVSAASGSDDCANVGQQSCLWSVQWLAVLSPVHSVQCRQCRCCLKVPGSWLEDSCWNCTRLLECFLLLDSSRLHFRNANNPPGVLAPGFHLSLNAWASLS